MSEQNTIVLSKPIMVDGSMTSTIKITKPTFKDFIAFGKQIAERNPFSKSLEIIWRPASETEVLSRMIKSMCNLNDVEIERLDPDSAFEIGGALQPFLEHLQQTTPTPEQ